MLQQKAPHFLLHFIELFCSPISYCFHSLPPKNTRVPTAWLPLLGQMDHNSTHLTHWGRVNENVWIAINISLKFVPRGPINNIPTLVQIMAWRRAGDKPLSEPMKISLPMHIYASLSLNELNKLRKQLLGALSLNKINWYQTWITIYNHVFSVGCHYSSMP